jgi:hypothetical protein
MNSVKVERIQLSRILRVVESAIRNNPETPERSMVDRIVKMYFDLEAVECGDGTYEDRRPRIPMPPELADNYANLYSEWAETGNFPWRLKVVVVDGRGYYLGYVSDTGLDTNRASRLFERGIWLYPVDAIDAES